MWSQFILWVARGSWKTTALGIIGALYVTLQPILSSGKWPTEQELALAVLSVLAGLATKDYNKSGTGAQADTKKEDKIIK
jgi:hypothetical protein